MLPTRFRDHIYKAAQADLVLVLGTSLSVYPFGSLPELVREGTPRVLFNLERVGSFGTRPDDVVHLGPCDAGVRALARELGWLDEIEATWRALVGDEEAARQELHQQEDDAQLQREMDKLGDRLEASISLEEGVSRSRLSSSSSSEEDAEARRSHYHAVVSVLASVQKGDEEETENAGGQASAAADRRDEITTAMASDQDADQNPAGLNGDKVETRFGGEEQVAAERGGQEDTHVKASMENSPLKSVETRVEGASITSEIATEERPEADRPEHTT